AVAGRGVGLDLVRDRVERIGGSVAIEWRAGEGTTVLLQCPPTPASLRALLVRVGPYTLAVPESGVERVRAVAAEDLASGDAGPLLVSDRDAVPVHDLGRLLGPPFDAAPAGATALVVR